MIVWASSISGDDCRPLTPNHFVPVSPCLERHQPAAATFVVPADDSTLTAHGDDSTPVPVAESTRLDAAQLSEPPIPPPTAASAASPRIRPDDETLTALALSTDAASVDVEPLSQSLGSFEIPEQPDESDITVQEPRPVLAANDTEHVEFNIIRGGTERGADLLVDNRGFQYTRKVDKRRPNNRVWRCAYRSKTLTCRAQVQ